VADELEEQEAQVIDDIKQWRQIIKQNAVVEKQASDRVFYPEI
jgi:hypothetical protein